MLGGANGDPHRGGHGLEPGKLEPQLVLTGRQAAEAVGPRLVRDGDAMALLHRRFGTHRRL
jgi:hypothetical protein